jgi:hypothetical protein
MRLIEFENEATPTLIDMLETVLPIMMKYLGLKKLPKITLVKDVDDVDQPTFGRYINDTGKLELAINNRHPVDVLRTLAHELTHYRQDLKHELGPTSGETGSPQENEAHELAGIIMRHIDKTYPNYLMATAIDLP